MSTSRVPFTDTEHLPSKMREGQKETTTGDLAMAELCNYRILRAGNYEQTPAIIAWDERLQNDDEPVPGGWMLLILTQDIDGARLDPSKADIWNTYDRATRDKMRESLKHAVIGASEIGLAHLSLTGRSLIWDDNKKKM
jgi:hypothetical protein